MKGYRILLSMMVWGTASITGAAPLTPAQQAFSDAKALAASAQASAAANVSNGSVEATVNQFNPTYYNSNGTAPESALFQNGNGNTVSAGQTKVADCATGAADPDPFLRQNCEAINLMVNNPSNRPQISIPSSFFEPSKAIIANANALTSSSLGINDAGVFSGCVNQTVGPPPTTEFCTEFTGSASQQCTVGRVVVIDEFTNYKCDKTVDTFLPQTCDKTLNVTVTQPSPLVATAVNQASIAPLWRNKTSEECVDGGSTTRALCKNTRIYWCPPAIPAYSPSGTWTVVDNGPSPSQCTLPPTAGQCPDGYNLSGDLCVSTMTASTSYSCPAGYSLSGSTCSIQVTQTAATNYYCPAGYSLSGSSCSNSVPASTSYSCPAGYSLSGSTCSIQVTQTAATNYYCPTGYSLSGSTCSKSVPASTSYSCPAGYSLNGSTCSIQVTQIAAANYYCPAGYSLSGSTCSNSVPASTSYSCPAGYSLSGSTCSKTVTTSTTSTYSCPAGYTLQQLLMGTICTRTESVPRLSRLRTAGECNDGGSFTRMLCRQKYAYYCPTATPAYSPSGVWYADTVPLCSRTLTTGGAREDTCPPGYTQNGTTCSTTANIGATSLYRCPTGYIQNGSNCQISFTATRNYTCPAGYTLNGSTCTTTANSSATTLYQCPAGYILSGSSCSYSFTASRNYSCPAGYTLSGTTCSTTSNSSATTLYQCPTGYSLSGGGNTCSRSIPASFDYICPSGYSLSGSTCSTTSNSSATTLYQCPTGYSLSSNGTSCTRSVAALFSYICPANTTPFVSGANTMCGQPPVITSTIDNGCAVQEAAAL